MKRIFPILVCLLLFAGCYVLLFSDYAGSVRLQSGEKLSFPFGSMSWSKKAHAGMFVVEGDSCLKEITTNGTVVIVDEQPAYRYEHRFTVYFVPSAKPKAVELIFRGNSFPIRVLTEKEWQNMKAIGIGIPIAEAPSHTTPASRGGSADIGKPLSK